MVEDSEDNPLLDGKYRVRGVLGEGGFGQVLLAFDEIGLRTAPKQQNTVTIRVDGSDKRFTSPFVSVGYFKVNDVVLKKSRRKQAALYSR